MWKLLEEGREGVGEVPADRWNVDRFYDPEPGLPGKTVAKRGGFVEGIDQFDPQFFGISPREAPYIDPQQRLLLETAYEAIEDGGMVLDLDKGTDMGVFVGISHNDYQGLQHTPTDRNGSIAHTPTGSAPSIAAASAASAGLPRMRRPSTTVVSAHRMGAGARPRACRRRRAAASLAWVTRCT
jgi:acyl transferase domain-containing protein